MTRRKRKPEPQPERPGRLAYTPEELAGTFGVTRKCVYGWIRDGSVRAFRVGRKRLFIPATQVEALLERAGEG